ncbi:filamentous growth regulator 23-like [Cucumis melo var. makuwa]|uniref:Filamentous growth regulator 23-like n=1 Tax=Cucumis melo var. makuwa TaxID=1194695 RepID=A0A5A7SL34_CUCMM|nr:filamentous growth regulator 23-like [Cucumis melo var. makuwa]
MALLFSLEGSTELTLKFSGSAAGLVGDSFLSLGKGFPTTGPRVQAKTVVIHRGLHVSDCTEYLYACGLLVTVSMYQTLVWMWFMEFGWGRTCTLPICASFGSTRLICASFGSTRLICASFGSTRLICASFGSTRLICASFGSTRLICASFGSTRLICAFYGTTRLLCRVGLQRGADRREAGRMREGHMDASVFLSLPLCQFLGDFKATSKDSKLETQYLELEAKILSQDSWAAVKGISRALEACMRQVPHDKTCARAKAHASKFAHAGQFETKLGVAMRLLLVYCSEA